MRIYRLAILCLALIVARSAQAQLVIEITEGVQDAVPIAVVPFGADGIEPPLDVAQVIESDLARTGRFAPMEREAMLERPTSGQEIDLADWRLLGTEIVIVGKLVSRGGAQYEMRFQAFDVFRGQQLVGHSLNAERGVLRAAAHRASDVIYEALTGERGAFSTRIAYVSVETTPEGAESYRLLVADADGENPQVVVTSTAPLMSPVWSPDAARIAYVAFENAMPVMYVQEVASGERRVVSSQSGVNGAPAWSPDGHKLALTLSNSDGNLDVYVKNLATLELRRVTTNPAIDTEPAFTRDGRSLYFTSDRSGGPQIYQVVLDGGRPTRLTFEGAYNARPRPSPDGRLLALVHRDDGSFRIAVLDTETRALRVLSEGRLDESPSFAPNGSMIIYATRQGDRGVLAAVSTDGRVQQRLASRGEDVREPAWGPFPPSR